MLAATLLALCCTLSPPAEAQTVVLRFQVIEADGFTETDPAIGDVRQVLQELFRFRGYRLAAETVIRVGGGGFQQQMAGNDGVFHIAAGNVFQLEDGGTGTARPTSTPQIAIRELSLWVGDGVRVLETSLTVPIGQTVVVGSAKPAGDGPVLILVVRTQPG